MNPTQTRTRTVHPTIKAIWHQVLVIPHPPYPTHPCLSQALIITHPQLLVAVPNMSNMVSHPTLAIRVHQKRRIQQRRRAQPRGGAASAAAGAPSSSSTTTMMTPQNHEEFNSTSHQACRLPLSPSRKKNNHLPQGGWQNQELALCA